MIILFFLFCTDKTFLLNFRQIPEYSNIKKKYDKRARGIGGTQNNPMTIGSEENLLCLGIFSVKVI